MIYAIILRSYVINRVVGDKDFKYEGEYDLIIEDVNENIGIGDWYEASEGVFYAPRTKPNDKDMPEELNAMWEEQKEQE